MSVQKNIILQRFVEMSSAESELGLAKQLELAKFQVLLLSSFYLVDVPFVFVFVFVHFFGHIMCTRHSEKMSQRS